MTKSRLFSKNSARAARNSLIATLLLLFLSGCSSSTAPTFHKENAVKAIQDLCKEEYKAEVKINWLPHTLWVYLPLEDIFEKSDKPDKYFERFNLEQNGWQFKDGLMKFEYLIKPVPEKEKLQQVKYTDEALDKISGLWKVIRRVLFSMEKTQGEELQFISVATADIKNGFVIQDLIYFPDLKKYSYELISMGEYQHRSIQDTQVSPVIIGDKDGNSLNYREITFREFICRQIQHRIKLKFQKPEVEKNADVDEEILRIIFYTLKTYGFKDFTEVEINNLLTNYRASLNQRAALSGPTE